MNWVDSLQRRNAIMRPSWFIEHCLERDGKPFRYYKRQHLRQIYDDPGDILLMCSRQTEKSTSLANRAGAYLYAGEVMEEDGKPRPIKVLFFSASWLQAADFSKDRLARVLESPCFTESLAGGLPLWPKDRNTRSKAYIDQIGEKILRNNASIKLRACHMNADRVRGVSSDVIFGDEIQDILIDLFPVIEESSARSPIRKKVYAGTPKTFDNSIQKKWEQSTQFEWVVRCPHCTHPQFLTEKSVGEIWHPHTQSGCICERCGKPMDPQNGEWINFGNMNSPLRGYRVCHVMLPQSKKGWDDILIKQRTYPEQQYFNEVLGFSHEHANVVLSKDQLYAACNEDRKNGTFPGYMLNGLSAGVDWGLGGKANTVLVIGAFHDDVFRVLYIRNFRDYRGTRDDMLTVIAQACRHWRVERIFPDYSAGVKENQDLARIYTGSGTVTPICYGPGRATASWDQKGKMVLVNRTRTLATLFNKIQQHQVEFFCREDMRRFEDGFVYTFAEESPRTGAVLYDHPENKPDDELQATNYAYLGACIQTARYGLKAGKDTLVQ